MLLTAGVVEDDDEDEELTMTLTSHGALIPDGKLIGIVMVVVGVHLDVVLVLVLELELEVVLVLMTKLTSQGVGKPSGRDEFSVIVVVGVQEAFVTAIPHPGVIPVGKSNGKVIVVVGVQEDVVFMGI